MFAVYHVSQPQATVDEIVADVSRAVRFIRTHAAEYRVDPDRLGELDARMSAWMGLARRWRRPPDEVKFLMQLFMHVLEAEVEKLHRNGIRLRIIGDLSDRERVLIGLDLLYEELAEEGYGRNPDEEKEVGPSP